MYYDSDTSEDELYYPYDTPGGPYGYYNSSEEECSFDEDDNVLYVPKLRRRHIILGDGEFIELFPQDGYYDVIYMDDVIDDFDAPALFPLKRREGLKLYDSYTTAELLLHPDVYDPS